MVASVRRLKQLSFILFIFPALIIAVLIAFAGCMSRANVLGSHYLGAMDITQGAYSVPDGNGSIDFGTVALYDTKHLTFTIDNVGVGELQILSIFSIDDPEPQFYIDSTSMSSSIPAGSSTSFIVSFKPTSEGYKSANIVLVSNASDESYTFIVEGTGDFSSVQPDITLKESVNDIPHGTGLYDFGNMGVGSSTSPVTFTISNSGDADLYVNAVSFTSGDTDQFSLVTSNIPRSLAPLESTTFSMSFSPTSSGGKSADISISNDDPDESPYEFSVTGYGEPIPEPDINTTQSGKDIPDGTGSHDFGNVTISTSSAPATFTIENTGTSDLTVYDIYSSSGDFPVNAPATPLAVSAGSSETFTVTFSPSVTGDLSATITIDNDDPDEAPYTFTVNGYGEPAPEPDIHVKQGSTDFPDGSATPYDFGNVFISGSSSWATFTVENHGTADLNLSSPYFSSGDTGEFVIDSTMMASPVPSSSSTSFKIKFVPTKGGANTAVVTLDNDDPDENPYTFSVTGYGDSTAIPDISVPDVEPGGYFDFGDRNMGDYDEREFTIENVGSGDLIITSVSLTSGDTSQFTVDVSTMSSVVAPSGNTKFMIKFHPTVQGSILATISTDTNDPDEAPYTFDVTGNGITAPLEDINLTMSGTSYPDGSTYNFGEVNGSATRTFTIENVGTDTLQITNILLQNNDPGYTLDLSSTTFTLAAGTNTTFDVTFDPQSGETKYADIVINNSDPDESPYNLRLKGHQD